MIPAVTASKIYSILGNNNSLVPLAAKDIANSAGLTAGSYFIGDKEEGQDRFIDEFGTQALWLFGIPGYKKLLDVTLFKGMGYDHKIDVRTLKNKEIFEKAKEFAHNDTVKSSLEKVGKNAKTFKGLTLAKFAISTLMTIGTYAALTKYRHKKTEERVKQSILAEHRAQQSMSNIANNKNQKSEEKNTTFTPTINKPQAFKGVGINKENNNGEQVAFAGGLSEFMFNPVKNLMIVDGAITGERLTSARSMQDFLGYTVKEGTFWLFMYGIGGKLQSMLENSAEKNHKKSIDLDARVIESDELKNAFKSDSLQKSLNEFANCKTDVEVYEFINKNPDNFIVKMAKKSDVVKTVASNENLFVKMARKIGIMEKEVKNADAVDTRAYIDIDEFKGVAKKLEKLQNQYKTSGENLDVFLNGVKKLKRASVWKNLGSCILALGVIAPAIMVGIRYLRDDKEFEVKERIQKELAFQGEI